MKEHRVGKPKQPAGVQLLPVVDDPSLKAVDAAQHGFALPKAGGQLCLRRLKVRAPGGQTGNFLQFLQQLPVSAAPGVVEYNAVLGPLGKADGLGVVRLLLNREVFGQGPVRLDGGPDLVVNGCHGKPS